MQCCWNCRTEQKMDLDYRIAVCDDEQIFIDRIRQILLDCEIHGYTDSRQLLQAVEAGGRYDVIFLDIAMPGLDGIGLAREIREMDEDMIIVFVTSRIEFMQTGYEVRAFRYLMKEQLEHGLPAIWTDIEKELAGRRDEYFIFEFNRQTYRYACREILYFESNLRRIILHAKSGTAVLYGSLDKIESEHPAFVRIHKSYLVNPKHIRTLSAGNVITVEGEALPVSRRYKEKIERLILV